MTRVVAILSGSMLAASCGLLGITGRDYDPAPGRLIIGGITSRIIVPDTVIGGVTFDIRFTTYGGGCTPSIASTEVTVTRLEIEIRPYDNHRSEGACTEELRLLQHHAEVKVGSIGVVTIRVIGVRDVREGGMSRTEPMEITRQIVSVPQ